MPSISFSRFRLCFATMESKVTTNKRGLRGRVDATSSISASLLPFPSGRLVSVLIAILTRIALTSDASVTAVTTAFTSIRVVCSSQPQSHSSIHLQPPTTRLNAIRSKPAVKRRIEKKRGAAETTTALLRTLQTSCYTPSLLLSNVGRKVTPKNDADGRVSSLVLVRLAKLAVERTNSALYTVGCDSIDTGEVQLWDEGDDDDNAELPINSLSGVCSTLATAIESSSADLVCGVDGIKAAGVVSRLLRLMYDGNTIADAFAPLIQSYAHVQTDNMKDHHLSGLRWAYDNLSLCINGADLLPSHINDAYRTLDLPFRIRPGLMNNIDGLTVSALSSQVDFRTDTVRTTSTSKTVRERRLTAWEGESVDTIPGFAYSGKVMETRPFSPLVLSVRDELLRKTAVEYDCCLLNLYPDGESGMRYHIDPDQGALWGHETAVVSVGATRRFAFRTIPGLEDARRTSAVHNFVVLSGDVTEMFAGCQKRFQHTVKTAENKEERAARSSLVYKRTLQS